MVNDGAVVGGMIAEDLVDGPVGKAWDFDGSSQYVNCGNDNSLDITTEFVIQVLFNPDSFATKYRLLISRDAGQSTRSHLMYVNSSPAGTMSGGINGATERITGVTGLGSFSVGNWYLLTLQIDQNAHSFLCKSNDSVILSGDPEDQARTIGSGDMIIAEDNRITNNRFDGKIAEVRIGNAARSSDWLTTEYNNLLGNADFFTLGQEEEQTGVAYERDIVLVNKFELSRDITLANALAVGRDVVLVQAFGFPERDFVLKNALAVERDYAIRFGIRVEQTWTLVNRIVAAERDIVLVNRLTDPVTRDLVIKNRIMEAVERDIVLRNSIKDFEPVERDVTLVNVLLPDPAARIIEHTWGRHAGLRFDQEPCHGFRPDQPRPGELYQ